MELDLVGFVCACHDRRTFAVSIPRIPIAIRYTCTCFAKIKVSTQTKKKPQSNSSVRKHYLNDSE